MKPIIIDGKDMSDSTELYEAKPNPFFVYFIYLIFIITIIAIVWMAVFEIDIIVENSGIFRYRENIYEISSGITGEIKQVNVEDGSYVSEGDVLFTVHTDTIEDTIDANEEQLSDLNLRLEMLYAYINSLDGTVADLASLEKNPYYEEFYNKRRLLEESITANEVNVEGQSTQYQTNIESIELSIASDQKEIGKIEQVIQCVETRQNTFDVNESYYKSIVDSYLSNYQVTSMQYDGQISTLEAQIIECEKQIEELNVHLSVAQSTVEKEEELSQVEVTPESSKEEIQKKIQELMIQKDALVYEKEGVIGEKDKTLNNLKLQQLVTLEQQKETLRSGIQSQESSLLSARAGLDGVQTSGNSEELSNLSEKDKIASEILTYENQKKELENSVQTYQKQRDNGEVVADGNGYVSLSQPLQVGAYVQEGSTICTILPEESSSFVAELYVSNGDIGQMKVGQEVKLEIEAYPSSEYGYFHGEIESISGDVQVDENTGSAYYLLKIKCEDSVVRNEKGEEGEIINGMACRGNVIVDEQTVLAYLLEKIDLLD